MRKIWRRKTKVELTVGFPKMVHLPPDMHAYIKRLAAQRRMTMSGFVQMCVIREVKSAVHQRRVTDKKQLERIDDTPSGKIGYAPFWAGQRRG